MVSYKFKHLEVWEMYKVLRHFGVDHGVACDTVKELVDQDITRQTEVEINRLHGRMFDRKLKIYEVIENGIPDNAVMTTADALARTRVLEPMHVGSTD